VKHIDVRPFRLPQSLETRRRIFHGSREYLEHRVLRVRLAVRGDAVFHKSFDIHDSISLASDPSDYGTGRQRRGNIV
jgi:hypothetical protein